MNLTASPQDRIEVQRRVSAAAAALPAGAREAGVWSPEWRRYDEAFTAPTQVNFAGKGGALYQTGYRLDGSIFAVLNHLRTTWIWDRVRVQGGAYGAMVQFDPLTGLLVYVSYRDPNLLETLEVYDRTPEYLEGLSLGPDELRKSIIGAVGDMDPCLLPDAAGWTALRRHLAGVTDEERQRLRDELLAATPQRFRDLAAPLRSLASGGLVVALGSPGTVAKANEVSGGRFRLTALL